MPPLTDEGGHVVVAESGADLKRHRPSRPIHGTDRADEFQTACSEPDRISKEDASTGDVPPILSSTSVESPIIRKGRSDVKKRFTEAQIIGFLREAEAGLPVKDLCRRHGFSEASYYLWRSKFGGMTVSDAKRLKELETENGRLKKLLAESQLEIEVTREVLQKKW